MMPFGGETVTLYNRRETVGDDGRTRTTWHRKALMDCFWTRRAVRTVEDGHVRIGQVLVCKIPESENYTPPDLWDAIADPDGRFTLAPGDIIVRGRVADEIGAQLTVTKLLAKYARGGCMTVSAAQDRCIGASSLGHYRAEGV